MNQHETYISAPDDSAKIVREAIPPPAQPKAVIPGATDEQPGFLPNGRTTEQHRGKFYGMSLAWRGLHLLGVAIGIMAVWYVIAWIQHGRQPLPWFDTPIRISVGYPWTAPSPIFPPDWLLAVVGLLVLISLLMMLLGTQDVNPKMKLPEDRKPNQ